MFLYMNISAKNNLYGISVENLARELKMDASTVSKILI